MCLHRHFPQKGFRTTLFLYRPVQMNRSARQDRTTSQKVTKTGTLYSPLEVLSILVFCIACGVYSAEQLSAGFAKACASICRSFEFLSVTVQRKGKERRDRNKTYLERSIGSRALSWQNVKRKIGIYVNAANEALSLDDKNKLLYCLKEGWTNKRNEAPQWQSDVWNLEPDESSEDSVVLQLAKLTLPISIPKTKKLASFLAHTCSARVEAQRQCNTLSSTQPMSALLVSLLSTFTRHVGGEAEWVLRPVTSEDTTCAGDCLRVAVR